MKSKLAVACAALLAVVAGPALAVQLGQIEIRSALNQPLVAAIPVHPKDLAELDGLSVSLASPEDFARAGLTETATDRTLRFHLVTDNNGQKLILVTSSEPVSDPYLDFLVQVNTRQGKEVREFVVLLNPVIATPAPAVQTAPVAGAAVPAPVPAAPVAPPPASAKVVPELPAPPPAAIAPVSPVHAQPPVAAPGRVVPPEPLPQARVAQPAPPAPPPPAAVHKSLPQATPAPRSTAAAEVQPGGEVTVKRGDTLYGIASGIVPGTGASLDQVMLALQAANPDAFYRKNINNLRAGAILRVPPRDALSARTIAAAAIAVRRQRESWQAAKAHPATVLEGAAAEAAAKALPPAAPPMPTSDHLTLAPASGGGTGTASHPGVAGGTGTGVAAGPGTSIQSQRDTLLSLDQSNAELQTRVQRLENLSEKTGKLLSLKDSEIAELRQRLAAMHGGAAAGTASAAARGPAMKPATAARAAAAQSPWYLRPLTWIIAALVVLALIVLGLFGHRDDRASAAEAAHGPLPDLDGGEPGAPAADAAAEPEIAAADAAAIADGGLVDAPADVPEAVAEPADGDAVAAPVEPTIGAEDSVATHAPDLEGDEPRDDGAAAGAGADDSAFIAADPDGPAQAAADDALPSAPEAGPVEPASVAVASAGPAEVESGSIEPAPLEPVAVAPVPASGAPAAAAQDYGGDPVDIKLDLARAYLDMGDQSGARAMLDEVLAQGSRVQQDEARRLLAAATE